MNAQLYFLFPEYKGDSLTLSSFEAEGLMSGEELSDYIRNLYVTLTYMLEENVECLYDKKNFGAFLRCYSGDREEYPSKYEYLLHVIEPNMESWRMHKNQFSTDFFEYEGLAISDNTLCEAAKRRYKNIVGLGIIINMSALKMTSDVLKLRISCNSRPQIVHAVKADACVLLSYLRSRGVIERLYLPNTSKHGTSGLGGMRTDNVSSLRCSDEEAKKMMGKAVKVGKHLYYFDKDVAMYIRFMAGGNNTFHPYHIESENAEQKNVPSKAKKVLKLLLGDIKPVYD